MSYLKKNHSKFPSKKRKIAVTQTTRRFLAKNQSAIPIKRKAPASAVPGVDYSTLKGYDGTRGTKDQSVVVKAKMIRQLIKFKFPGVDFRVQSERYSMGESINVFWADGPAFDKVEPLLEQFKDLNTDGQGEILSGGNSFVEAHRDITPESNQWLKDKIAERFGKPYNPNDRIMDDETWRLSRSTDFPNKPAPKR